MARMASSARSQNTHILRHKIFDYITLENGIPLTLKNGEKSRCGFNHPITARLLCPFRDLAKFDADPQYVLLLLLFKLTILVTRDYMTRALDGQVKITAKAFPTFLYDERVSFDPTDHSKGLLRSRVLVLVSGAIPYSRTNYWKLVLSQYIHRTFIGNRRATQGCKKLHCNPQQHEGGNTTFNCIYLYTSPLCFIYL